jgi:hypothetical protein
MSAGSKAHVAWQTGTCFNLPVLFADALTSIHGVIRCRDVLLEQLFPVITIATGQKRHLSNTSHRNDEFETQLIHYRQKSSTHST